MAPSATGQQVVDGDTAVLVSRPYQVARVLVVALGVGYALSTLLPAESRPELLDTWFYSLVLVLTSLLALARPVLVRRHRAAWACVGLAVTSWSFGDIYWSANFASVDASEIPVPSLADLFYLGMYPLAYAGFILLARTATRRLPAAVWLDGVVTSLAAGAVFSALTLEDILAAGAGETLTNLSYPIGDLVLLVIAVAALAMVRWRPDPVWWLLGLGAAFFAVADTAYLFGVAHDTYVDGRWVDGMWMLGLTMMAYAGSLHRPRPAAEVRGFAALLVPILFSLSALSVLVVGTFVRLHPITIILAGGCLVAAGVRTALTFEQTRELARTRIAAETDELTGLGNRRLLDTRLPALLGEVRAGYGLALIIVSVDHVTDINGTLGYHAGDAILQAVGERLRQHLPAGAVGARLGGVELAIVCPPDGLARGAGPLPGAAAPGGLVSGPGAEVARDVRALLALLAAPVLANGVPVHIALSAGIALAPEHAAEPADLIRCAAEALRHAKANRSEVEVYDPGLDLTGEFGPLAVPDLLRGLRGGEFVTYYQPKVDVATGTPVALEGQLRWRHPVRGEIDAAVVLPLAARVGLARQMSQELLRASVQACAAWRRMGVQLGVAADLTAADVLDSRLPYDLAKLINGVGIPPSALTLEIAEDVLLIDPRRTATALAQFRGFGVRLALDHYGRSAPSLTRLRSLPIDELKLDASFVGSIQRGPHDAAVVRSTVDLARSLDIVTVADGIDSRALLDAVVTYGCSVVQGLVLGAPQTLAGVEAWLSGRTHAAGRR